MAPHSSTLAWKIPWMEELQSLGSLRVGHDWATSLSLFTFMHWRRKWQPTPVFLPGESQGREEPGRLPSMGSHRVGLNWTDLAAAAAVHKCYPKAFFFQSVCLFVWLSIGEEALICWQILYLHTVFICCSQVMNDAWVDEAESFFLKHYLSGVLQILETSSQIWSESNSFTLLHTTILSWGYYSNNISLGWV